MLQYYRDEPALGNNGAIIDFPADNNGSPSFRSKTKISDITSNDGTQDVKIMVPLKYLSNIWRTLQMLLINCENNLILTWSANCFIIDNPDDANEIPTFELTDTKLYAPVVTLSIQDNNFFFISIKIRFKKNN